MSTDDGNIIRFPVRRSARGHFNLAHHGVENLQALLVLANRTTEEGGAQPQPDAPSSA